MKQGMTCRLGCGACCIAPTIKTPLPGWPNGKPAGVPCPFLDTQMRCSVYGQPQQPAFCRAFQPEPAFCGENRDQALDTLSRLEQHTGVPV